MHRIDNQMLKIYKESTKKDSIEGKRVSPEEVRDLILRAQEMNESSSGSCFSSSTGRGDKNLKRLVKNHKDDFSHESRTMIKNYFKNGQLPHLDAPHHSGRFSGNNSPIVIPLNPQQPAAASGMFMPPRPSHPTPTPAAVAVLPLPNPGSVHVPALSLPNPGSVHVPALSSPNPNHPAYVPVLPVLPNSGSSVGASPSLVSSNPSHSSVAPVAPNPGLAGSGSGIARPVPGNGPVVVPPSSPNVIPAPNTPPRPEAPVVDSPDLSAGSGIEGPKGKEILKWKAVHPTSFYHWFPMQETKPGGDATNNLYAMNGALAKLDMLTGANSRQYEFDHNRKAVDAGKEFGWWGHCDKASTLACILEAPKHNVTMMTPDGKKVTLSKNDIQGLMVKVAPHLATQVDFKGERYNNERDDPNEPYPDVFLDALKGWAKEGLPFVMDIDPTKQVWNFPYDQATVYESSKAPKGFNAASLPQDGSVKFYHIEMAGTGFDAKARTYECYVQRDAQGKTMKSGWIKTPNTHNNPDFMWRPHPVGDLRDEAMWVPRGKSSNPEVDAQIKKVFEIYWASMA
jgi:hypothetical protein